MRAQLGVEIFLELTPLRQLLIIQCNLYHFSLRCSEEAVRKHRLNTERRAVRAVTSNGGIKGESASRPRLSLF